MDPVGPACPCFRGFECLILTLPCKGFVLSRSQLLFPVWLDMHTPARQAERERHEKMWLRQKQAFNCSDRGQCADTAERGHPNIAVRIFTLATLKPFQSGKINAMSTTMDCLCLAFIRNMVPTTMWSDLMQPNCPCDNLTLAGQQQKQRGSRHTDTPAANLPVSFLNSSWNPKYVCSNKTCTKPTKASSCFSKKTEGRQRKGG